MALSLTNLCLGGIRQTLPVILFAINPYSTDSLHLVTHFFSAVRGRNARRDVPCSLNESGVEGGQGASCQIGPRRDWWLRVGRFGTSSPA